MNINHIYGISYDSNIYIIDGKKPTIVDCGTGLNHNYVLNEIKKIISPSKITQIIITHEHFDHCGGVKKLYEIIGTKPKIMAHKNASEKISNGESNFAKMLGGTMPKMLIDIKLKDNDEITIGSENYKIIHTPGHSPGCLCLYSSSSKTLFSGDTIFACGYYGRYDFPEGNLNDLKNSIEKIAKLDVKNLYPGHDEVIEGDGNNHIKMTLENVRNIF